MYRHSLTVACLLLLASPAWAAQPSGKLRSAIDEAVKAQLLDPSGAVITHLDYDGGEEYCGFVQYKGSWGKHVFKIFIDTETMSIRPNGEGRGALVSLGPRKIEQLCSPR